MEGEVVILSEINKYLAPSGYEVFYKGSILCKRKGGFEGQCTGLEGFFHRHINERVIG